MMVNDICYYAIGNDLYIVGDGEHEKVATCVSSTIAEHLASAMNLGLDAIHDFEQLRKGGFPTF